MEQEIILNEHNKQEYPPMHTAQFDIALINRVSRKLIWLLILILFSAFGFTSCIDALLVKIEPITVKNSDGGESTVYFRDGDHDELFLSTTDNIHELGDSCDNIAVFYKPIYFKVTGDTLHIMGNKPDCFHPELTDACIKYHWIENNPLCYEKQARKDGYKIIHSLWSIDEYNE